MKQIIFDLDDTLHRNKVLREKREKAILGFIGKKKKKYLEFKKNYSTIESFERLGYDRKKFFEIIENVPIELNVDKRLVELFYKLKKNHKLIVIGNTSSYCVEKTLKKLGVLYQVDEYYGADDFDSPKPNIDCFFMLNKEDICVGNNIKKDLEIPKKLGAITVLVDKKIFLENLISVDFSIKNIYELEKIVVFPTSTSKKTKNIAVVNNV